MAGGPSNLFPEQHNSYDEDEIETYLLSFYDNSQFETLQDIGFKLDPTPEIKHSFSSSSGNEPGQQLQNINVAMTSQEESMPDQQLQNINIATASEMQQNVNVATSSKKAKQNINVATSSKKKRKRKSKKDDDSWMPVGWTKEVKKRGSNGKFPGYEDTFYRAPGVKRAFRSIVEAQRYINKQKKASIVDRN